MDTCIFDKPLGINLINNTQFQFGPPTLTPFNILCKLEASILRDVNIRVFVLHSFRHPHSRMQQINTPLNRLTISREVSAVNTRCSLLIVALTILCLFPSYLPAEALNPVPKETISGKIKTSRGFAWKYAYDIVFTGEQIIVSVGINLVTAGVTKVELDRVTPAWRKGIEDYWSSKYALSQSGNRYPIIVKVGFRGPRFHHDVIVRPGKGHSDELNWHLRNSPELAAHEFGHMLGAFDEYEKGALDPDHPLLDNTSIMTGSPRGGKTYPRHYARILGWFEEKSGLGEITLQPYSGD